MAPPYFNLRADLVWKVLFLSDGIALTSGLSRHWVKSKNPQSAAVLREASEDWGK